MRDENTVHIPDDWLVPTAPAGRDTAEAAGRYRLCFEVASGGMATVYMALYQGPVGFEKVVALKTIHKHLAKEQQFVDMFFDEARIAAHIDHPFVCRVIDFGHAENGYYIAMEYLLGEPLSAVYEALGERPELAASPDRPLILSRILADICEGLHAAHDLSVDGRPMNIVHRDVTPQNLFALYDGTVRVVDFGIATARDKLHQTELGTVKGKYAYVSPEQLELKKLDRRSDVWALGVVFWELLTGQRLFKRESHMETMRAVGAAEIPAPSDVRPEIPAALDAIVLGALRRDRADRYPDARTMAHAIEGFLTESGRSVTRADIGGFLDDLFPGAAAKKRQLVELTRKNDPAVPLGEDPSASVTTAFRPEAPTTVRDESEATTVDPVEEVLAQDRRDAQDAQDQAGEVQPSTDEPAAESAAALKASKETKATESDGAAKDEATVQVNRGAARPKMAIRPSDRAPPRADSPRRSKSSSSRRSKVVPAAILALGVGAFVAYLQPWSTMPGVSSIPALDLPETAPALAEPDAAVEVEDPATETAVGGEGVEGTTDAPGEEAGSAAAASDSWPPFEEVTEDGPPGQLQVNARGGWAEIRRGDEVLGRTPLEIPLPPGRHRLVLVPHGDGEPRPLDVEIRSERNTYMTVTLAAAE